MAAFYEEDFFWEKNQIEVLYNFRVSENKTDLLFQRILYYAERTCVFVKLCFNRSTNMYYIARVDINSME